MGVSPMPVEWNGKCDLLAAALAKPLIQIQTVGLTTRMGETPMPRSERVIVLYHNP
jgi:hypothetical protein